LLKKLLSSKDSTIVSQLGGKRIVREPVPITKEEPLRLELQHFVHCVQAQATPMVSGESARDALEVAFEISRKIQEALASERGAADFNESRLLSHPTQRPG